MVVTLAGMVILFRPQKKDGSFANGGDGRGDRKGTSGQTVNLNQFGLILILEEPLL